MLDPQVATYVDEIRALNPPPVWEVPLGAMRSGYDAAAEALFGAPDEVHSVSDSDADGVPIRIYRPSAAEGPATVFFHGGGWVNGSIASHDRFCQTLAARSHNTLIAVGYRLAPEHPFPAAIDDAWKATAWAARKFGRLALAGDSAGGQLAASVAFRARDANLPVVLQALIYPVTDYAFDTDSYRENTEPVLLTEASMRWYWEQYLPAPLPGRERDYAPLRAADLDGLPAALVLSAQYDPLRDEGELYAARLKAAGVPTTLSRYEGMVHGFIRWPARVDAAARAIDEVAAALRAALA